MPAIQPPQSMATTPITETTRLKHSPWFYVIWILVVVALLAVLFIAVSFIYVEWKLQNARQDVRNAGQQANEKNLEIQQAIDASQ